ncbi:MAG: GAF domain-containing protein, partial [Candidatus Brocadiales bacterium]
MKVIEKGQLEREVVDNIHRIIATTVEIRDVYTGIVAELKKVMDLDRASISLPGEKRDIAVTYVISTDYDSMTLQEGKTYPLKDSILERTINTGRPVIIEDTENNRLATDALLLREGIRSRLSVPLRVKENVVGSINLGSKK